MIDISSLTEDELAIEIKNLGLPAFRGRQIYAQIHKNIVLDFNDMTNLSKDMRVKLAEVFTITKPKIVSEQVSSAGDTAKLLLEFSDGTLIEVVVMLYHGAESRDRQTVCISTQAGCAMGCKFCATGLLGFERNLTAGEIEVQVLIASKWLIDRGMSGISNVVYMGMGEPFLNYDNVVKSIGLLNGENGQNIGARRITVSTCGIVPKIYEFADLGTSVSLALSLHAPTDELRSELMPVNRQHNVRKTIAACNYFAKQTGRRITYEYALFAGVNDGPEHSRELGYLLKGSLCHINVIPANFVSETGFLPSDRETLKEFCEAIRSYGIEATVRQERGADIDGACGQLRSKHIQ